MKAARVFTANSHKDKAVMPKAFHISLRSQLGTIPCRQRVTSEHQQLVRAVLPQLLIALVNRAGGSVDMSEKELKATAGLNLAMQIYGDEKSFRFEVVKKSGLARREYRSEARL
jgi:hypothetical protein